MARKQTCPKCDRVLGNRRQLKVHVTYCVGRPSSLSSDQRKFLAARLIHNSMLRLIMADLAGAPPVVRGMTGYYMNNYGWGLPYEDLWDT